MFLELRRGVVADRYLHESQSYLCQDQHGVKPGAQQLHYGSPISSLRDA